MFTAQHRSFGQLGERGFSRPAASWLAECPSGCGQNKTWLITDSTTAPAYNSKTSVLTSSAGLEIRSERVYNPVNDMQGQLLF